MCIEDALLRLKANHVLFNFIQQAAALLTFASSVICYFTFTENKQSLTFKKIRKIMRGLSIGMWLFTFLLLAIIATAYYCDSRKEKYKSIWGDTIYHGRRTTICKKKQRKRNSHQGLLDHTSPCRSSTSCRTFTSEISTDDSSINYNSNHHLQIRNFEC